MVGGVNLRKAPHDPRGGGGIAVAALENLGDEEVGLGAFSERFPGGIKRLRADIETDQF